MSDGLVEEFNRLSPEAQQIVRGRLTTLPESVRQQFTGISERPSMEKPSQPQEPATDIPLWQRALHATAAPFEWVSENVTKPFGSIVTSPFTPSVPGTEGMDWLQKERAEYNEWKDPALRIPGTEWDVGVKGVVETLPWLAIPSAAGMVGKLGGLAAKGGALGTVAKIGATALKPIAAVEQAPFKLVGAAVRKAFPGTEEALARFAAKGAQIVERVVPEGEFGLPSVELQNQMYRPDNVRRFAQWAESKPIIGNVIKSLGGGKIFVDAESDLPNEVAKRAISNYLDLTERGTNIQRAALPRLQQFGDVKKALGMDENGLLNTAINKQTGRPAYFYDILEKPADFKFSSPQAEQFVKEFSGIRANTAKLLEQEGLKQGVVHRVVKGIVTQDGRYVESKFGSNPALQRIYDTQEESVLAHLNKGERIVYGLDALEVAAYDVSRTVNRIARKRMTESIGQFGKTAKQLFNETYPEKAEVLAGLIAKQSAIKTTTDVVQRVISYKAATIPGATIAKIRRDLPEFADRIEGLFSFQPSEVEKLVTTMGRDILERTKLNLNTFKVMMSQFIQVPNSTEIINQIYKGNYESALSYFTRGGASAADSTRFINLVRAGNYDSALAMFTPMAKRIRISDISDFVHSLNLSNEVTGNALNKAYQLAYKTNRQAFKDFAQSSKGALQSLLEQTKVMASPLVIDRRKFLQSFAGREHLPHQVGEDTLRTFERLPEFRNKFFPDDVVNVLEKHYGDTGNQWTRTMGQVSAMSRNLTAVLDDSAPFIQGLFVFGRRPDIWAKSTLQQFRFLANPKTFTKYMANPENQTLHAEMAKFGSTIGYFEPTEALPALEKLAARVPVIGNAARKAIEQTYGRAEAAFTGLTQVARDNMWKAMSKGKTPEQLQELARTLDLMTGNISTRALGISTTQREIEAAWLFFSPRFTRASFAFIGDAFRGGMTGAEARKSIAGLMAAGTAMYIGVSDALGQNPDMNPKSGRFMTIQVGDQRVGVGGILYSMARLGGNLASVDNPSDLLKVDRFDNPFVKFMYGKSAPLTGAVVGFAERADYMGRPFETPGDWVRFVAQKAVPFSVQSLFEKEKPSTLGAAIQLTGLRQFPRSSTELRQDTREKIAIEQYGKSYDSLTGIDKRRINDAPDVTKYEAEIQKMGRDTPDSRMWKDYNTETQTIEDKYRKAANFAVAEYRATQNGTLFKKKIDDALMIRRDDMATREISPKYQAIRDYYQQPKTQEQLSKINPLDQAKDDYYKLMYDPKTMYDQFGNYNFDMADTKEQVFVDKYGQSALDYVKEYQKERWPDRPAELKQLEQAKEVLTPYWQIADQIWGLYPSGIKAIADQEYILENKGDIESKRAAYSILRQYPQILRARELITVYKKRMRLQNPVIQQAYNMFY